MKHAEVGKSRRKGLTLLEVMMAMVIVFIISTLLTGTLISTAQFALNIQEYTTGTTMGQSQLNQLLLYTPDQLANSSGNYGGIFSKYTYNITIGAVADPSPDPFMSSIDVTITTPGGRSIALNSIVRHIDNYGISADVTSGNVFYVDAPTQTVQEWHPGNTLTSMGGLPSGGAPRGLGGSQDNSVLWVADTTSPGEIDINKATPSYLANGLPGGGGSCSNMARLGGMASGADNQGEKGGGPLVYMVDRNNRGVWCDYMPYTPGHDWKGLFYPGAVGPFTISAVGPGNLATQGEPLDVALEYNGVIVWVTDISNLCVRRFNNWNENNDWDPVQYRPPTGMGAPIAVACSQSPQLPPAAPATTVMVIDLNNLYILTAPVVNQDPGSGPWPGPLHLNSATGTWASPIPFPAGLKAAAPCGLSWDDTHKVLYINTIFGQLWTWTQATGTFVEIH